MDWMIASLSSATSALATATTAAAAAATTTATQAEPATAGWLTELFYNPHHREAVEVAQSVLVIGLVAAAGLFLGTVKVFRISLGIGGVLFAGLLFGHLGFRINPQILHFAREFGLILFVYTIGMQVGPGFLSSLRRNGLPLNLMAASIVLLGVAITVAIALVAFDKPDRAVAVGLFSGATTNTPSLAAARQALKDVPSAPAGLPATLGNAYAVAYPFGILGIIFAMLLIRGVFRINTQKEGELLAALSSKDASKLETLNLELKNPNLDGLAIRDVPTLGQSGVVISRVLKAGQAQVAHGDTVLKLGDVLLAVGPREGLEDLKLIVGAESKVDVKAVPSHLSSRRLLVTKPQALGKSIRELDPLKRFGVVVTRIHRAEVELPPAPDVKLQFADHILVVGEADAIKAFAQDVGDAPKQLNHPHIIPIFLGIALGVILGSWPISVAGMPAPVKLGLAGGPLLVAIVLSRIGNIGPLVWYMPMSANFMLRELGIVLFLACVGLDSGGEFVSTLRTHGLQWMFYGALITAVPLLVVGLVGRTIFKVNYMNLCGLLSGSMTDPPALAFAGQMTGSEAPHVAYATVYPLVMILRIITAQVMILMLMR